MIVVESCQISTGIRFRRGLSWPWAQTYAVLLTLHGLMTKLSCTDALQYDRMFNLDPSSHYSNGYENMIHAVERPYFDTSTPTNVTVEKGHTAFIPCKIKDQGSHVISWMRYNRHLNIISVGSTIFYPDERYSISGNREESDWTLRIVNVKHGDSGIYECQIGTAPKISRNVTLKVINPPAQTVKRNSSSGSRHGKVCTWLSLFAFVISILTSFDIFKRL